MINELDNPKLIKIKRGKSKFNKTRDEKAVVRRDFSVMPKAH